MRPAGPALGSEAPHAPAQRRVHPLTCALCPSYLYSQVKAASSKRFRTSLTPGWGGPTLVSGEPLGGEDRVNSDRIYWAVNSWRQGGDR